MFSYSTNWLAYTHRTENNVVCLSEIVPGNTSAEVIPQYQIPVRGQKLLAVSDAGQVSLYAGRHTIVVKNTQGEEVGKVTWRELNPQLPGVSACFVPWPVTWLPCHCRAEEVGKEYMIYGSGNIHGLAEGMFFYNRFSESLVVNLREQKQRRIPSAQSVTYSPGWGIIVALSHDVVWLPWDTADIGVVLFSLPHPISKIVANGNLLAVCCPVGVAYVADIGRGEKPIEVAQKVIDIGWHGDTLVLLHAGNPMRLSFVSGDSAWRSTY